MVEYMYIYVMSLELLLALFVDDEVIHMLADYERSIGRRQRELEGIRKRKEELRRVEEMLQDLQVHVHV